MSRTYRTNKYGEVKTDKFKINFNGCGCGYCEFINTDFRNKHNELFSDKEMKESENFLTDRHSEREEELINEQHYLDSLSNRVMLELKCRKIATIKNKR